MEGNVLTNYMYTIIIMYLLVFFINVVICATRCIQTISSMQFLVLWHCQLLCCMLRSTTFLGMLQKNDPFNEHPPYHFLISKMNLVLTNQGATEKQVVDTSNLDLDECNIRGGYNTINMMDFFKA